MGSTYTEIGAARSRLAWAPHKQGVQICEVLHVEKKGRVVSRNRRKREMGSYYLMGIEFQFCKMEGALEMDGGGDGCIAI